LFDRCEDRNDVVISLLEEVPCESQQELIVREQYWIDHYRGLGKLINQQNAVAPPKPVVEKKQKPECMYPKKFVLPPRAKKEKIVPSREGSHDWVIYKLTSPETSEVYIGYYRITNGAENLEDALDKMKWAALIAEVEESDILPNKRFIALAKFESVVFEKLENFTGTKKQVDAQKMKRKNVTENCLGYNRYAKVKCDRCNIEVSQSNYTKHCKSKRHNKPL
jgi:hypothetical protein